MRNTELSNLNFKLARKFIMIVSIVSIISILTFSSGIAAQSSQSTINISVNDSINGEDYEKVPITVSSKDDSVPNWVNNDGVKTTSEQFLAFDANGDAELTDDEVRQAVSDYVINGDLNNLGLSDDDIRQIVSDYVINA